MNRRQLLARTAALAAALAADPLVSMSGSATRAGDALLEAQAAPVGGAEREVVAAIRRVLLGLGSPPAETLLGGDLNVMVLDRRVKEAWKLRKAPATWSLARCFPGCSLTPRSPARR
jgi:hypothetical protein